MNCLKQELLKAMNVLQVNDNGQLAASFTFREGFTGFGGHFPGNPVVPGVCLIQAVTVLLEDFYKTKSFIEEVAAAKFFMPISARQEVMVVCVLDNAGQNRFLVHAKVSAGDKKVAQFELKVVMGE